MDVVGVMAAYLPVVSACTALSREALPSGSNFSQALYKAPWWWISCDPKYVGAILNIFKYFIIILIVPTNYIFVHLLDNKVF